MGSSQVITDVDLLLQPISPYAPAGESLRYEGTYDRIQEARREEMELPQGVWQHEPKRADWSEVERLCQEALSHRTKDLQIAIWLTEAWIHLYALPGFNRGVNLIRSLHELYWETMFPPVDDLEYRTGQLTWMNEKLSTPLKFIAIAIPIDPILMPQVSYARWEAAQHSDQAARRRPHGADTAKPELPLLQRSMSSTPDAFYRDLSAQISESTRLCQELDALLDGRYGAQNPGLRQLQEVLDAIRSVIAPLVKAEVPTTSLELVVEEVQSTMSDVPAPVSAMSSGIRNRNDAYRGLAEIAEFLSRTEPHSPVPYLIRRAIAWGGMDLGSLLPELLRHEGALNDVASLLQIDPSKK